MYEFEELCKGKTVEYDVNNTFVNAVCKNAKQIPDKIAVVFSGKSYTYAELDELSDCIATMLVNEGVKVRDFVGIMMPRCIDYPAAVLGVMKAGAAYVPIDLLYPKERCDYMISDSKAKIIITMNFIEKVKKSKLERYKNIVIDVNSPAYMIYTSGSTGKPKGVVIPHSAIAAQAGWLIPEFGLNDTKKNLSIISFAFDGSTMDLLYPLMAGAQLHILSEEDSKDIKNISDYIKEQHITGMASSTSLGIALLNYYDIEMDYMMLGGEKLTPFKKSKTKIYNGYGPTEFTVNSSFHIVNQDKDIDIPIGRPIPNTWSFVCDENGNPVEKGVIGEICLVGPQMALGYWGLEEKTKNAFVEIPFEHSFKYDKMYKTGDLGRYNDDGNLEYCGRIGNQVKLRGFRIEMGEIENVVASINEVLYAVAEVKQINSISRLCLYYVLKNEYLDMNLEEKIKEECKRKLAAYMVPDIFVKMDSFPMTPNGKVDRKSLPLPEIDSLLGEIVEPETAREKKLLSIAKEILSFDEFGVTDSLSRIGMTSLKAIEFVAKAKNQNILLKVGDVLSRDNIRDISKGLMHIASWYEPYDAKKKNMVLISGIFAEKYNIPRMKMWSNKYNILFIEPIDEHYKYIFQDADYTEVVEFYYTLAKMMLDEVSDFNIDVIGGFCFGGILGYSIAGRYYEDTGKKPKVFLGDTASSYCEKAIEDKSFEQEVSETINDIKEAFLTEKEPNMSKEEFDKLVYDNAVLLVEKFMIAKKVGRDCIAKKGPFEVVLYNCVADKDRNLYINQWKEITDNLTVIDVQDSHFSFCMDMEGKYLAILENL